MTPPLLFPVWTRVRHTRTGDAGIVRATKLDKRGPRAWWWLYVETTDRSVWWMADLCEHA